MKTFNGKAIYNPSGKAGECNFYVGCSNGCTYCYCKKGILAGVMGQDKPQLKDFKGKDPLEVFQKELMQNLPALQEHGIFFSFTTDPMLRETRPLTLQAMNLCLQNGVHVKILTKRADWLYYDIGQVVELMGLSTEAKQMIAFGFTLTGHDELEPNASTNAERIEAMRRLHNAGFKTWASIEPIVDLRDSCEMVNQTRDFCNHYKIGLMSGKKFPQEQLLRAMRDMVTLTQLSTLQPMPTIYFKDSLLKAAGIDREALPANCVGRDYDIFNAK